MAEDVTIEWREGDAFTPPFTNGAFEVVLCQQGLQFFPDKPGAPREMHRVVGSVSSTSLISHALFRSRKGLLQPQGEEARKPLSPVAWFA